MAEIHVALAGNPNCGKTTLFNALTGSNQYVGNWPGVTVEKKEGKLKARKDVIIQDLPGIYSLSPYTLEEVVARNYLVEEKPDAIINIVDGTNIERNLYLTTQIIEIGIPTVIAVNMMDLVKKNGDSIDFDALEKKLRCKVIPMSALRGDSILDVAEAAIEAAGHTIEQPHVFSGSVEHAIAHIEESIENKVDKKSIRWFAVKVFERDEKIIDKLDLTDDEKAHIEEHIKDCEAEMDDDAESIITNQRYNYITDITSKAVSKKDRKTHLTVSDKIDRVVTNRIFGLPIFAVIMFMVYAIAMGGFPFSIGTIATNFTNDVIFGEWVPALFDKLLALCNVSESSWIYGLVQNGIVAGVGAVLGFVPQILVLFILLAILEDIGYMARVAFVMDRVFRQFGLSGKSFIPALVATGCGVPGVMASRTIENDRDRKLTVMTTTFMPCSAKLPIIGLVAGAIFGKSPWIAVSAYFIGITSIVLSGIILKKIKALASEPSPFVMELPSYHVPSAKNVFHATWERGWSFIKRAGSVILISTVIIWFLSGFGFVKGKFGMVDSLWEEQAIEEDGDYIEELAIKRHISPDEVNSMDDSLLASAGQGLSVVFRPLGFGSWKPTVATLTGLVAKEEVISTFGVLYNYDEEEAGEELGENGEGIWDNINKEYNAASGFAFMIFNLLCAPCFAAIGAIKREMNSGKWTAAAIGWMTVWAYALALIAYQIIGLIQGSVSFGVGTVAALITLGLIVFGIVRKGYKPDDSSKTLTSVEAKS